MLKSALQKGSQSFNDPSDFGIDSISSVRVLFSTLLKSDWDNDIFANEDTQDALIWTLCIAAPYLTEVLPLGKMIVLCAHLPNGPEIIEIICACRPQWARIALDRK